MISTSCQDFFTPRAVQRGCAVLRRGFRVFRGIYLIIDILILIWYKFFMKKIFISYAHKDEKWKNRLVKQLKVLEPEGFCDIWEDRKIRIGDDWKPEIETALNESDIAILMVSADFLVSNFIRTEEVPRILERRKSEGLLVIPVFVKPCPWERVEWLSKIQGEPLDGKTLAERSRDKAERVLADLAGTIAGRIQADAQKPRMDVSPPPVQPVPQSPSTAGHMENPFTDTMAIRDAVRFIGRKSELRRLEQMLRGGSVSLQGDHKIGKSSLLWKLAGAWEGTVIGPLSFQTKHWDEMVEEITVKSGKSYKSHRDFRNALLDSRALVLLDEMELGPEKGLNHNDCSLLRGCLEENRELKIVIASRKAVLKDARFVGVGSPLYNICLPFLLGPFEEADARHLLAHPWAAGVPMFEAEIEEELLSLAIYPPPKNQGYHPYLIQRAAYHRLEALSDPACDWKSLFLQDKEQQL